ncbi:MAG: hypothetical protein JXA94_04880 [Parachlamydiales bacterium]|nr:hypothetical protein [Parachlamydiales bacterium]
MICHKCSNKLDLQGKIGFKDICPICESDLHVCKNCRHYIIGKPNDCNVPNTEYVADREKYNFCEDFSFKNDSNNLKKTSFKKDIEKNLFKDVKNEDDDQSSFEDLFKD